MLRRAIQEMMAAFVAMASLAAGAVSQRAQLGLPVVFSAPGDTLQGHAVLVSSSAAVSSVEIRRAWPHGGGGREVVTLPPGKAALYGFLGGGLLVVVSNGPASTLYAIDTGGAKPAIREVYSAYGPGGIAAVAHNAQEQSVYLVDSSRRVLVRLWVPAAASRGISVKSCSVYSLPSECFAGSLTLAASLSDDPSMGIERGVVLFSFADGPGLHKMVNRHSMAWRMRVDDGRLILSRISLDELSAPPECSWSVRSLGDGLVRIQGRRWGQPELVVAGRDIPFARVSCVPGRNGSVEAFFDMRSHKDKLGLWWKVIGGGMMGSNPFYSCLVLPCFDGAESSSLRVLAHYPNVIYPGVRLFPLEVDIGDVLTSGLDDLQLVMMVTALPSNKFWDSYRDRVDFSGASCAVISAAELESGKCRFGIDVPGRTQVGDVCAWQALVLCRGSGATRLVAASCVYAAPIVEPPSAPPPVADESGIMRVDLQGPGPADLLGVIKHLPSIGLRPGADLSHKR